MKKFIFSFTFGGCRNTRQGGLLFLRMLTFCFFYTFFKVFSDLCPRLFFLFVVAELLNLFFFILRVSCGVFAVSFVVILKKIFSR
jgi:hypothetical protein